ncbi:transposase [Stakelama flava]|uniref:transposase n=1 Tax=Stakelama flava TaxID=2860338 RepID=UPI001FED2123|nr:transposase [Stakelama flava]
MRGGERAPAADAWICEELTAYIVEADRRIAKFAQTNPVTRRLMQVPGVGPICAASFYSIIENPHRFARSTDVGAYLGMVPKLRQSGTSLHHARITRTGNAMTRSHLFLAASVMLTRSVEQCAIRDWGAALRARVGYRKARLAVARKIATAMLSIWKTAATLCPTQSVSTPLRERRIWSPMQTVEMRL